MSGSPTDIPPAYQAPVRGRDQGELLLDLNEGAPVLSDTQLAQIVGDAGVERLGRYPDASALTSKLAERLGVDAQRVLVTGGGDDAIDRLCRARLGQGEEIVLPSPTFEMIGRYARLAGATVRRVAWWGGAFPLEEIINASGARTRVVAVVSPNNPTGAVISPGALAELSRRLPGAVLMVDLAYTEFASIDLTQTAMALPNTVVIRTFSKAYGLAGARVGFAAGPQGLIEAMRASGGPFPCSGLSLKMACAALDTPREQFERQIERVRAQRSLLTQALRERGCEVLRSEANFVLARFGDAARVWETLSSQGVRVRRFDQPELGGWLRIGCPGTDAGFVRLMDALASALDQQENPQEEQS